MSETLSTVSSCQRARWSIGKSTKRSCSFCFTQCTRRDESYGRTNHGCFTMTMHLLTTLWASGSSWLRRTSPCWNNLPVHLILLCVSFFFSTNSRGSSKWPILKAWRPSRGRKDGAEGHPRRILPAVHRTIEAWQRRMEKCIWLEGEYSEGETM